MRYSLTYLKRRPTLFAGQTDDLKIETSIRRVWLARTGIQDGEPFNNRVSIEELSNNGWKIVEDYQAR